MTERKIKRHPALIVLAALLDGQHVEMDNWTWALSKDYDLIVQFPNEHSFVRPLGDREFSVFIRACMRLTDEELIVIGANHVLNEVNRDR